jgi:hypothetical protein
MGQGRMVEAGRPTIRWIKVKEAVSCLWTENPKQHDIGSIVESLTKYGIQELPVWDGKLNGGKGAIKAGNGRVEALWRMEKNGYACPRGIIESPEGWLMPVIEGVEASSEDEARAYAVDSNNLVLAGGEFLPFEVSKLWGSGYMDVLKDLYEKRSLPVSVDEDTWDILTRKHGKNNNKIRVIQIEVGLKDYPDIFERIEGFINESDLNCRIR